MSGQGKTGEGQAPSAEGPGGGDAQTGGISPQSILGAYQSPLDAPESAAPAPAPFDPEGRERLGDAAVGDILQAIQDGVDASNTCNADWVDEHVGKRIDGLQAETLAQIAAHTAALKNLSDGLSLEAHREELRRLSGSFVGEMERTLDPLTKRIGRGAAASEATYTKLDERLRLLSTAQKDAAAAMSEARKLRVRDWRSLAVVAVVAVFAGGMSGAYLNSWVSGSAITWGAALDGASDATALCEDMGFQVLQQSDQDLVCARVFRRQ